MRPSENIQIQLLPLNVIMINVIIWFEQWVLLDLKKVLWKYPGRAFYIQKMVDLIFTTDLTTYALCEDLQNIFEKLQKKKNGGNFFGQSFLVGAT